MRIAIVENLANSAYIQAKALRRLGHEVDLILDPLDHHAMSDPRWEDLDLELPPDQLAEPELPPFELPAWVRVPPGFDRDGEMSARPGSRATRALRDLRRAIALGTPAATALRRAGPRGVWLVGERAWIVRALLEYECVIAYGGGCAWAALAGVPCVAETWGGDITMLPFYDSGDWEGHDAVPLPGPRAELFAQAKLQRMGYEHASRIVLTDPRFAPFAERLGVARKCVQFGFLIDVEKYRPRPEPELRERLLGGADGVIVFVPARQDFYWKGSDRLLKGFAAAAADHPEAVLVCAGWGADLERSERLIAALGIAEQVRMLPYAMSKERLRRYYCAADIVADQFTVGSYGGSALEAMSCARPLLIALDTARFNAEFDTLPPVINVHEPDEISAALLQLFDDRRLREALGSEARDWVCKHHGPSLAQRVLELCQDAVDQTGTRLASRS